MHSPVASRELSDESEARRVLAAVIIAAGRASEGGRLPNEAEEALRGVLARAPEIAGAGAVAVEDVVGSPLEGYSFELVSERCRRSAFALEHRGRWVFAPGPIGAEDIDDAALAFRQHLEPPSAVAELTRGACVAERAGEAQRTEAHRTEAAGPLRVLWPHERDPRGWVDEVPLVFLLDSATGTGPTYYCGHDPFTGESRAYDH